MWWRPSLPIRWMPHYRRLHSAKVCDEHVHSTTNQQWRQFRSSHNGYMLVYDRSVEEELNLQKRGTFAIHFAPLLAESHRATHGPPPPFRTRDAGADYRQLARSSPRFFLTGRFLTLDFAGPAKSPELTKSSPISFVGALIQAIVRAKSQPSRILVSY